MKRISLIILAVAAIITGSVSCGKVNDIDRRLTQLEQAVSDLKAQILAGAVITTVDKTDKGCTFTLSNGQSYTVTNGKNGTDGEAIIADVKIEENFIVLTLKNGETLRISYQNPLSMVTLSIIPDFSDGSVYSYGNDGSFFLRVSVKPEKYIEKLLDNDAFICKADFRSVITKATEENPDFTVVGEITYASVEEGYMTTYFDLTEDEMEKMWDADYAVSFSIEDTDGVHGASTPFVPVSWYLRDGRGGDEEIVEVGGYTVTVKIADGIDSDDIMARSYVDGDKVIVKAISLQNRYLVCKLEGDAQCERTIANGKFTFTISNIGSNIEAVLGYSIATISVSSDSNGKVWIGDDESKTSGKFYEGQQVVIHAAPNDKFRLFRWNDNNRETSRTFTVGGEDDVEYSASFISSDLIPGLFTVNADGKQVFFSKGNLYCSGAEFNDDGTVKSMTNAQWGFEANQYKTTPNDNRDNNHISHFMWCCTAEKAIALKYDSKVIGPFFAEKNFTVNGASTWLTLTGGDKGEWKYLINKNNECGGTVRSGKYKCGVKVCDSENCLILLPDDWKWGENGVGSGWLGEYSESTTVKWSTMENAGAVCLPADGYRDGGLAQTNPAPIYNVGYFGNYWSSTRYGGNDAYSLYISKNTAKSDNLKSRSYAWSVRLVTEVPAE